MPLFSVDSWIKSPSDRDVIARWTAGKGEPRTHALALPPAPDPERFSFLVVGDTGDAEMAGTPPVQAVAREMASEFESGDPPALVLHLGDVVYMTGEKRLYDRSFRRPYSYFLTPESTADNLVFRVPFLPVPGNHDYYDLRGWVRWLARVPLLGPGLRAVIHQLFAFGMPEGGSDMGRAFMEAFVQPDADTSTQPLRYTPGSLTRLPNRYYRFRYGSVDFFALDSNTLDAPPPWRASPEAVREEAAVRIAKLQEQYHALDAEIRRRQRKLEAWRQAERQRIAYDPSRRGLLCQAALAVADSLALLSRSLQVEGRTALPCRPASDETGLLSERWRQFAEDLRRTGDGDVSVRLIEALEEACDDACGAMRGVEGCLSAVSEGDYKAGILAARERLDVVLEGWSRMVSALPQDLCDQIRDLSERALDTQRELALERRRLRSQPEDYDATQIDWLKSGLEESMRNNPDGWRVVYLHHPLFSAIHNHCERPDILGVRTNLTETLRDRAHLVLGGHAHAFEWFRNAATPEAGVFVSGGGGQVSLRRSIFDPRKFAQARDRYDSMRAAGATEWCGAGRGPGSSDGETGNLYHFLRVEVTPESLLVRPVGVRRLGRDDYRREQPMPVYHVAEMGEGRPGRSVEELIGVEVRRDGNVRPRWAK